MTDTAAPELATTFEYVQPIVLLVDRDEPAPEDDGIAAVAVASVSVYAEALESDAEMTVWEAWLSGPFAKSVRRADRKTFDKLLAAELGPRYHSVFGKAEALAFAPMPAGNLPKVLSKLQVSGTQLPNLRPGLVGTGDRFILMNEDLEMSTGKKAAQAAHALFAWHLRFGVSLPTDFPLVVRVSARHMKEAERLYANRGVAIRDAGRTEIEPGSLTAIAI